MAYRELAVQVSGPLACFTRPEYAAERVSYPVVTPTAAVGLLSSILWKPEFRWVVRTIWVQLPVRWLSMTRNEVSDRASLRLPAIDVSSNRKQRHSLCLRDVAYVIFADLVLQPHATEPEAKYRDQFRRRVARGACHSRPYLGLQEFHADFRPFDPDVDRPDPEITIPVGSMPLDVGFGPAGPAWFPALVDRGVLVVPDLVAGAREGQGDAR